MRQYWSFQWDQKDSGACLKKRRYGRAGLPATWAPTLTSLKE